MIFTWIALILFVVTCAATALALVWGWARWARQQKARSTSALFSLIGFALTSASFLLAAWVFIYAQSIGGFAFYDPRLMRINAIGGLLSLGGIGFAAAGTWKPSPLRWHALFCGAAVLLFWAVGAAGE